RVRMGRGRNGPLVRDKGYRQVPSILIILSVCLLTTCHSYLCLLLHGLKVCSS
ncbi:hypothetical protein BJV78DRAFT_1210001, partial [Lactifluus subvellereus]